MLSLILWALVFGGFYFMLEVLCREKPKPQGPTWFEIAPHLTVSKKARGRGEVNRDGLTRREQARS